jgi:chromate transporter
VGRPELATERGPSLGEIAWLFVRLGAIAFGGPAAHIAMMEDEVVRRRGWLTGGQFLDFVGATNLIPGPNSTEIALHIGHARHGWRGLVVAGTAFILPSFVIVAALAWAYVRYGHLPQAEGILYGVKPVVMAVVAQALWRLGRTALRSWRLGTLGLAAVAAAWAGVHELAVLAAAGALMALAGAIARLRSTPLLSVVAVAGAPGGLLQTAGGIVGTSAASASLLSLFLVFFKAGAVLFGSGYVLLAFLRADLVERLGWLTETQLLDAIAIGQVTPGPLSTTATFIGYVLAGPAGAFVATVGMFLPAYLFVAMTGPLIPRLRESPAAGAALDGVNVASLALMAVVSWQLAAAAITDGLTVALALASLVALVLYRVNSAWLVAAGAAIGLAVAAA